MFTCVVNVVSDLPSLTHATFILTTIYSFSIWPPDCSHGGSGLQSILSRHDTLRIYNNALGPILREAFAPDEDTPKQLVVLKYSNF